MGGQHIEGSLATSHHGRIIRFPFFPLLFP